MQKYELDDLISMQKMSLPNTLQGEWFGVVMESQIVLAFKGMRTAKLLNYCCRNCYVNFKLILRLNIRE